MKIRKKEKIPTLHLEPGDTITLSHKENGIEKVVLDDRIGRSIEVNEAVIFDVEAGDFGKNITDGIGGAFLSTKRRKPNEQIR